MAFALAAALLLAAGASRAQNAAIPPATAEKPALRVAVVLAHPFAFKKKDGFDGYSIRLWKRTADEAGIGYQFTVSGGVGECLKALSDGRVDAVVGPLSITSWREPVMDFSYPFYESGLGMAVSSRGDRGIPYLKFFSNGRLLILLGILLVAIAINAHIMWFLERKNNSEGFPKSYVAGIGESLWYSIGILIVGYGDKEVRAGVARVMAVVWMLAGVALYSYFNSSLISFVTVSRLTSDVTSIEDLRGKTVAAIKDSAGENYVVHSDFQAKLFPELPQAVAALMSGQVAGIVDDAPLLRYEMKQHPSEHLQMMGETFEKQDYAFGLQKNSPYRKIINAGLLKVEEEGILQELNEQYFGAPED